MKNKLLLLPFLGAAFFANAQNVGIGTPTPDASALLHVYLGTSTTQGFLVNGTFNGSATIPNLGTGSRMMFYPGKAAFRAGFVNGAIWDNVNVGLYSAAMGFNTTAFGENSFAMGYLANASGHGSIAMGNTVTANGPVSIAMGQSTTASGGSSVAIGAYVSANADFSIAIGEDVTANSYISTSLGRQNDPIVASPTASWVLTEPLLIVGNGTSTADKKNAFAIAKNGNIYIDPSNKNDGTLTGNTLQFGSFNGTGEGMSSKRTAGGNQNGLDFYTGSANRMSITNGGYVGIGMSTPGFPLNFPHVLGDKISLFGNSGGHYGLGIQDFLMQIHSDDASSDIAFGYGSSGSFTEKMRIKGNGNVGIGTTSPGAKLHISAGDASLALFGPNPAGGQLYVGATSINQTTASTAQVMTSDGNLHIDPAQGHNLYIGYFQPRDIYLNPTGGKVGIGTTTPANTLDVTGDAGNAGNFVNTSTAINSSGVQGSCDNTPGNGYGIIGKGGQVGVLGQAILAGAGNRVGFFGSAGNGANNYGVFSTASGGTTAYGIYGTSSGSTTNYGLSGSATGGTNTYGVYGSASGATTNFAGYFVGNVLVSGTFFNSSDRKLKNDIKPLRDAMSIINQLKPSVYTFRTNEYKQMNLSEGFHYGLIADEVQQVVPGAVKKAVQPAEYEDHDEKKGKKLSDEVEFKAVNYTEMIPILIAAMKEQQVMIEELKNKNQKIDQQQQQINELLKEIKLIKEKIK